MAIGTFGITCMAHISDSDHTSVGGTDLDTRPGSPPSSAHWVEDGQNEVDPAPTGRLRPLASGTGSGSSAGTACARLQDCGKGTVTSCTQWRGVSGSDHPTGIQ